MYRYSNIWLVELKWHISMKHNSVFNDSLFSNNLQYMYYKYNSMHTINVHVYMYSICKMFWNWDGCNSAHVNYKYI